MSVGSRLWRLLGGRVSDDGNPVLEAEDWVVIFEGDPDAAVRLVKDLESEGIETRGAVTQPFDLRELARTARFPNVGAVSVHPANVAGAKRTLQKGGFPDRLGP